MNTIAARAKRGRHSPKSLYLLSIIREERMIFGVKSLHLDSDLKNS